MSGESQNTCPNGHPISSSTQFCQTCGAPVARTAVASSLPPLTPPTEAVAAVLPPLSGGAGSPPIVRPSNNKSSKRNWIVAAIIAVVVGLGIGGVVLFAGGGGGTVVVKFIDEAYDTSCANAQSNKGLYEGDTVNVTGDHGSQIARGVLGSGSGGSATVNGSKVSTCTFTATITVPSNQQTYSFRDNPAGNSIAFTRSQLERDGWVAGITTGNTGGTGDTGTGSTGTGSTGTGSTGFTGSTGTGSTGFTGSTGTGSTGGT